MTATVLPTTASAANAAAPANRVFGRYSLTAHRLSLNEQMRKPMSDNRKYYYLKLKEGYFDDDSIILLESIQDGILYSYILLKLYLKPLKKRWQAAA